jgi:hypothetical protein
MNRLLILFVAALLTSWAAGAQTNGTTNEVVRLKVTVMDVAPLGGFTGALTPTEDVDPRFALTVRIESTVPAITNLQTGTVVTFAVHSPSRFLSGRAGRGQVHDITMPWKKAANLIGAERGRPRAKL